jgi:hypothetical protein
MRAWRLGLVLAAALLVGCDALPQLRELVGLQFLQVQVGNV